MNAKRASPAFSHRIRRKCEYFKNFHYLQINIDKSIYI